MEPPGVILVEEAWEGSMEEVTLTAGLGSKECRGMKLSGKMMVVRRDK